jgi:transcriptional regulator with PAS, ATPase and Fis domain
MNYAWPGNVRELVNVLERAQILAEDNTITIDDLPENMIVRPVTPTQHYVSADNSLRLDVMERLHVLKVLDQFKHNKVHAARALGVSRRSLYRLIEKYQLEPAKSD